MRAKVFKIGLRQQLIVLVLLVTSFSLMILAIITGVYFSANYKSIRASRLEIVAQMKASQVQQNLNYVYYQAYWLAVRDAITKPLISYRAGNTSSSNWADAEDTIEQFLRSSATFTNVRLYDTKFTRVVSSESDWSSQYVPEDVLDVLYILDVPNITMPDSLDTEGFLTGPVINSTDNGEDSYVMSMTLPIYSSASILVESSDLAGYLTAVMTAQALYTIMNDTTLTGSSIILIKAIDADTTSSDTIPYGFVLPPDGWNASYMYGIFSSSENYIADQVLRLGKTGSTTSTKNEKDISIAAGYSPVDFNMTQWAAIVETPRGTFLQPSNTLTKIIIGVVFGTAVLMGMITFPLAHWAVQPILRLQQATETIALGRGLQAHHNEKKRDPGSGFSSARGSLHRDGSSCGVPSNDGHESPYNENGSLSSGALGTSQPSHPTYLSDARVPEYSRYFQDELSKLTETFNVMTDELDRQYSKLEERVKARTKQLEAAKIQAEAANEAKTVFIANISHELRTPLNGILGMTAIAMAENDQNKIQQSLKLIFRSGELLLHILTELLTFSKNSLKRSKLENSNFTAMEVALQIKSIFGKLAKDQNVNMAIRLSPNDIRKMILYGDSNRIIQVVMNLVSNALKFTPVDGNVTVTVKVIGEYDPVKSQSDKYEQVHVKRSYSKRSVEKFHEEKLNTDDPSSSSPVSNTNSSSSNSIEDEKNDSNEHDEDHDDHRSIITASTSSYDDNVFSKQFKSKDVIDPHSPTAPLQNAETRALQRPKTWVFEFIVEDTGPGIDPKLQKSVFEPFIQGDQTLSRQYGGTGLGLSICTQLASMMNGVIDLESTVGVGSKFTFRVPLLQQKEFVVHDNDLDFYEDEFNSSSKKNRRVTIIEPEKEEKPDLRANGSKIDIPKANSTESPFEGPSSEISENVNDTAYFDRPVIHNPNTGTAKAASIYSFNSQSTHNGFVGNNLKILVAEDNNVNQEVIKRMLNLEGFTDIELAVDGEEATAYVVSTLKELGKTQYDIIFMDVQMPKVDGLQATKQIRNLGYKGPIVALTAFTDESNVKECLDAGMIGFLAKPIRRSQLRQILIEYCPVILKEAVTTPISDDSKSANGNNNIDDSLSNDSEKSPRV